MATLMHALWKVANAAKGYHIGDAGRGDTGRDYGARARRNGCSNDGQHIAAVPLGTVGDRSA